MKKIRVAMAGMLLAFEIVVSPSEIFSAEDLTEIAGAEEH